MALFLHSINLHMQIMALIGARGCSNGLKNKNLLILGKKSLIEHTIHDAINSKKFDRIIVSTDDDTIARVSKKAGAEVPFLRPKKFSKDTTIMKEVVSHALSFLKKQESYFPDIVVVMQPTSPFRDKKIIQKSLVLLKKSGSTSVISVAESEHHPFISFFHQGKFLKPLRKDHLNHSLRQKRTPVYHPTGSLYTFWSTNLKKYNSIHGPKIYPLVIKNKSLNHDIDDLYDLFLADMTNQFWAKYKKPKVKK